MCFSKNPLAVLIVILSVVIIAISGYVMHNKKQLQENLSPVFEEPKYGLSCEIDRRCTPENNCFPGSYMRSQVYQNMCEPTDTVHLLKDRRHLQDNCLRSLAIPFATKNLKCKVNIHDQRKCEWNKNKN